MFLSKKKPTSPALRWGVTTTNKYYKRFKIKKLLPHRVYRGFECKKAKRKSLTSPSTKHYKLLKHFTQSTTDSRIVSIHKIKSVNYTIACVSVGKGNTYYIKAAGGMVINLPIPPKTHLINENSFYMLGDRIYLGRIPTGGMCYSLNVFQKNKWSIAEAAGTFCKILWHEWDTGNTAMNLPSKKFIKLHNLSMCNVGRVSNQLHKLTVSGNARDSIKKKNKVLSVRGIAMNPIDHPNGGRANTRRPMRNPWGHVAKKGK